jgi:hypothetical protein
MDVKSYYKKIREKEQEIASPFAIVSSLETPDGGRAGVLTEVTRELAARMMVEGRGRLANEAEVKEYREARERARLEAEERELAGRLVVNFVPQAIEPAKD